MLARTLGRSVRELLETVDAAELAEWEAYYAVEPWGEQRSDQQSALIACAVANQWVSKGSSAKVRDFMPDFWKDANNGGNLAKMLAIGRAFAASTNAKSQ